MSWQLHCSVMLRNNVVSLKDFVARLQGRLSRQGLLSVAGGWETPGVVARTVSDAALLLAILQDKVR